MMKMMIKILFIIEFALYNFIINSYFSLNKISIKNYHINIKIKFKFDIIRFSN